MNLKEVYSTLTSPIGGGELTNGLSETQRQINRHTDMQIERQTDSEKIAGFQLDSWKQEHIRGPLSR